MPEAVERQLSADNTTRPAMAKAEADLLRAIERALERHREQEEPAAELPTLVGRIETILGKSIEAANQDHLILEPPEQVAMSAVDLSEVSSENPASKRSRPSGRAALPFATAALGALLFCAGFQGQQLYRAEGRLELSKDQAAQPSRGEVVRKQLSSPHLLSSVVSALHLDRDPEFGGTQSWSDIAIDLISPSGKAMDPVSRAEAKLAASLSVSDNDAMITYGITTHDKAKSVRLANDIAAKLSSSAAVIQPNALRAAKEAADAELAAFTAKSGQGNVSAATNLLQRVAATEDEMNAALRRSADAQTAAGRLKSATADQVIAASFPPSLASPALTDLSSRYAQAKANLARLSTDLGPRHPKLIAGRNEADELKLAIGKELSRLQRQAEQDMKTAEADQQRLRRARESLIAQGRDTGVDLSRLASLRAKAEEASQQFEDSMTTASISPAPLAKLTVEPDVTVVKAPFLSPLKVLLGAGCGFVTGLFLLWYARRRPSVQLAQDE